MRSRVRSTVLITATVALVVVLWSVPAAHALGSGGTAGRQQDTPAVLGHAGRFLTNPAGQVVIVHGLDMVSKVAPYEPAAAGFGAAAAQSLAVNGFAVVRLGIIYSALEPRPGVFSASYIDSIERTVAILARQGIYSLLDFHQDEISTEFGGEGFPAWSVETGGLPIKKYVFPAGYTSPALNAAFTNFWADSPGPGGVGLQQRYADAWRYVADRFANDPWVLGYDLFNEPWAANGTDAELGAFYSKVIAAIRSVDKNHLIFYEPFSLFDFGQQTTLPQLPDSKLAMSFHDYCAADPATEAAECAVNEQTTVTNALTRSSTTGDALVETEFGATDDLADISRVKGIADASGISWIEWSYCGCDDPTGSIPPATEGLVTNPSRPATGSNVNAAKLDVLAEPYPRVTAGTPETYSFDATTRTMSYTYSVVSPRGKHFGIGSCTAVVVPAAQYPNGYSVKAEGARVTSRPGAGVVTLARAGKGSGSTITVQIQPTSRGHTATPELNAITACR